VPIGWDTYVPGAPFQYIEVGPGQDRMKFHPCDPFRFLRMSEAKVLLSENDLDPLNFKIDFNYVHEMQFVDKNTAKQFK